MLLDDYKPKRGLTSVDSSDEALLSQAIRTPHVFETLLDRYQEAFLRKAHFILGNREAAEDAVQDAFVKIYRNAHRFEPQPGAGFKSWAYRILLNTCFTAYQRRKREGAFLADLDPEFQELVADRAATESRERSLDTHEVSSLINRLPDGLSSVMRLHFIEGKPHAEVAKEVGISEGAVRARVHRAKKELKKIIARFGGGQGTQGGRPS